MSGGKFNNNRNSNINSNRKSYRDYNSSRYNSHSNYQSNPLNSNMYSRDGTNFSGSDSTNNRTYYNDTSAQKDRYASSYKKPYTYNPNYTKTSYYQSNDFPSSDYSNPRYESKRNYNANYQHQATNANQGYRYDQNYQYANKKFDQNMPNTFQPIKPINALDKLINEPMRKSIQGDVIERYLSYCKKMLKDGTMKEQELVVKFEEFKKLLFCDNFQDESTSIQEKLNKRRLEKDRAAKKALLSKLSYGVSAIHLKNIEDVIAREKTRLDELSLL